MIMMSSGTTETLSTSDDNQELTEKDIAELIEFIEQLWQDEEVRKEISRKELDEFISLIKKSCENYKTDKNITDLQ